MTFTSFIIDRIVGGKIVEEWQMTDFLGLMQQLGLVSLPQ
jgi:predicted ester cyclase